MKEEVLFRKLIADGEGVGEERRFQQINSFFRDARFDTEHRIPEAVKVIKFLDSLEFSVAKQKEVSAVNIGQAIEFVAFAESVDSEIANTHKKMEDAKKELNKARQVKRNRQEYYVVVKQIEEVPSRSETTKRLQEIRDELDRQHDRQRVLESKLTDRRNHLHAFNIILSNLQRFISDDDDNNVVETGDTEEEDEDAEERTEVRDNERGEIAEGRKRPAEVEEEDMDTKGC